MLVGATGGTGFVGSHSIAAMVGAGHRVRLLVRDASKVDRALAPLGVAASAVDVVVGDILREVTGRRLPALLLPAAAMVPIGRLADAAQRRWRWHIPAEYGAIYTCACATAVAEHADTCGIDPRPVIETMRDTVRWLYEQGHVSAGQAGRLKSPGFIGGLPTSTAAGPGEAA